MRCVGNPTTLGLATVSQELARVDTVACPRSTHFTPAFPPHCTSHPRQKSRQPRGRDLRLQARREEEAAMRVVADEEQRRIAGANPCRPAGYATTGPRAASRRSDDCQ